MPTTPTYVTFSGLLFNARSAANCWNIIAPLLLLMNVNIIAITETWFSPDDDFSVYELQGFSQFCKCRYGKRGGGVMLCIKSTLSPKLLSSSSPTSTFDMISVQFFTPDPTIITLVSSPDCSHTDSICLYRQLSDVLNHAGSCNILIFGDFNLPYICWDNLANTRNDGIHDSFHELCLPYDLHQIVSGPTRGRNLLDLILVSHPACYGPVTVEPPISNSDHDSITFELRSQAVTLPASLNNGLPTRSFAYAKANYDLINAALLRVVWNDVFVNCINVNEY